MAQTSVMRVVMWLLACLAWVPVSLAAEAGPATTTQPAASRPASEIVLARVGPTVITQEDFNAEAVEYEADDARRYKAAIFAGLIIERQAILWLKEHPDVVPQAKLEETLKSAYKEEGVQTRGELEAKLRARGNIAKLDDFLNKQLVLLGRSELAGRSQKASQDESVLRDRFEKDREAFDGSRRRVRHILIATLPWETPEQIQAKRDKLAQIRNDIVSGRRTWEQYVDESSDIASRSIAGDLGLVPRHLEQPDSLAKAAFETAKGGISEIFETSRGLHILQVTDVHKGQLTFGGAKSWIKLYVVKEQLLQAELESQAKFPAIGVREPDLPPRTASRPATSQPRPVPSIQPPRSARPAATKPKSAGQPPKK